jgi:streptomycin 6-kinase
MSTMVFPMPRDLVRAVEEDAREDRRDWLERLPSTVDALRARWSLDLGKPFQPGGLTAWVAPARRGERDDLVLKVGWRHLEAEHEPEGLRAWRGEGAVRLHEVERIDDTVALLLERCVPGTSLKSRPEPEQDGVIASLLRQLWRVSPGGQPFRPLAELCDAWADGFEQRGPPADLDPGLAREGIALFRSLAGTAERQVLLCTDLHAGNVLAAKRSPWLMIDPKPYVGDPTYDALQHLLNCEERLHADPHGLARRVAAMLALDGDRLLLWLFARCVQESADFPALVPIAHRVAP